MECIIQKMSRCETECKNAPLGKQNVMKFVGGQRIDQKRKNGVEREKRED